MNTGKLTGKAAILAAASAVFIAQAETYYWNRATAVFTTASGWTTADGNTTATLQDSASFTTYANDDFVVRTGKAITTGDKNTDAHYINTKSFTLEGDYSRFFFRGRWLENCHFNLNGGSVLYCWGRNDSNTYNSTIRSSSSIHVNSSATHALPAIINEKKENYGAGVALECPISGDGALRLELEGNSAMIPFILSADNSEFTGMMKAKGYGTAKLQEVRINNANALSGNPAAFEQYGLELQYAKLSALVDSATTANRGLYIAEDSTIDVASGKTLTIPGAFAFANASKTLTKTGAGTLVLSGGLQSGATCGTMKLNAGTLAFSGSGTAIDWSKLDFSAASSATLALNGGATLVVDTDIAATANLTFTVNGGVIDTANSAVTIAEDIGGTGSVTFKGGNTATLSGTVGYSGKTFVVAGTTIAVSGTDAATILSHGLDLAGTPALNTPYTVLTSADDLSEANLDNVTCSLATSFTKEIVGGNSIVVTVTGDIKHGYWTGAAGDYRVSNAGNWSDGTPAAGDALDFSGVASGTTIIGDTSLTYGAVTMGTGVITFSGAFAATSFSNTEKIAVAANSTVTLDGDLRFSNTTGRYILDTINAGGRFVVTGDIELTSSATAELKPFTGGGALVAKGLVANKGTASGNTQNNTYFRLNRPVSNHTVNWIIGPDGLSGSGRFWCFTKDGSLVNICPDDSDFEVKTTISVDAKATINLNTTGSDGNAHKISFVSPGSVNYNGTVNIKGTGTVELDRVVFSGRGTVNVQDTATITLKRGADTSYNALLAIASGATLEIAESAASAGAASVTRRGDLRLNDGAKLKFNFTDTRVAPVLAFDNGSRTLTADGAVTVKILSSNGLRPKGGAHVLTTCGGFGAAGVTVSLAEGAPSWARGVSVNGDGNLVLNVKPKGMVIIVK